MEPLEITIDRTADRAVFRQIADALAQWIAAPRGPRPGDRLPSEAELIEQLGVARMTVRQAIQELRHTGLVTSEPGRGVFVASQPWSADRDTVLSFAHVLVATGRLDSPSDVICFFEKPWKWDREYSAWCAHHRPDASADPRHWKTFLTAPTTEAEIAPGI